MRVVSHRGKWAAEFWIAGKRHRASLGLAATDENRQAAERKAIDLERELAKPAGDLVAHIWTAYLADRGGRIRFVRRLEDCWRRLEPTFGHLRPDQITRKICRDYAAARPVSNGTVIKELNALRAALRWHDRNTPAQIETPPAPPPKDRHLTRAEMARLLEAAETIPHLAVFLHVAIGTGARKAAIFGLQWHAVDFDRGCIHLGRVIGGKNRATVPMSDTLRAVLQGARERAMTDFVVEYAGRPVGSIRTALRRACERAGIAQISPHVLRHTAAVWMAERGISMPRIAQYLGHADSRITERVYARFSPDHLRDAAKALEL